MKQFLLSFVVLIITTFNVSATETYRANASGPYIEVALVTEHLLLIPGQTQYLGILLSPENQWHTYWRNAGDSGEAPTVQWTSSVDIEFGDIQWPLPEAIAVAHLVNYGYSGDNLLMVPITLAEDTASVDAAKITADLSWLVCKEDCIPGWATLTIELPIDASSNLEATLSPDAELFSHTREQLPSTKSLYGKHEITDTHLAVSVALDSDISGFDSDGWQLLPFRADIIQHNAVQQALQDNDEFSDLNFLLPKSDYFSLGDESIEFLFTNGKQGFYLTSSINSGAVQSSDNLLWLMLLAFAGGLLLNVMPCVLPVLSLKAMSLSQQSNAINSGQKWGFAIGVLASFWLFAAVILAVKAGGNAVGWGFHLQEPLVIAALAFLFLFIALMLFDVAPTGGRLAGMGQSLTQGKGFTSQFFTGVLAVIVASPCTAPFMATALGVAMVSPAMTTLAIFTALALGFALPMTLLSINQRFAALLPKPGAWTNTFKQFLAFPMLATVIWLVWVFQAQTGDIGLLWLMSGLLAFALCIWLSSVASQRFSMMCLILALLAGGYSSQQASDHNAVVEPQTAATFNDATLAALRKQNKVVLVNMTADWCITCKVNEQVAFNDSAFEQIIGDDNVHYMVGDWTNKNKQIFDFLTRYKRSGVPLYVVYAGEHYEQVLPQVLTTDIVIDAIKQAQQEINNATL
ncbi:hypothetical protein E2K93_03785 [Thalassotalea sp. HSM 43]|uniref:protein-disulfide reductase DsbD family protein n=1 Tax=Thalassotalea sp. HSM 43 TaxID=2552945 RepID=UPI001081669A|nr:thioredoxin family protein [Thalassotalea sp. HSM 43]QBY03553.1 hypothetical protein E2K93_03785 [Thalassotalea sp. HSM 43]